MFTKFVAAAAGLTQPSPVRLEALAADGVVDGFARVLDIPADTLDRFTG
jgi:hypothetical protein